ncbi:hypothetical protein QR680_009482 [Steinernema hermaphroditum]|uniref:Isocitrate dehydrogenase [NAD] subunit, mitochondrial n=1 Tax=Steinernema hermaphroditum TaxID=289476 RepID=A0AA39M9S5_9BILA|nr:hypothetical protein QR680_009482 [Steinernema hermaphroditum]
MRFADSLLEIPCDARNLLGIEGSAVYAHLASQSPPASQEAVTTQQIPVKPEVKQKKECIKRKTDEMTDVATKRLRTDQPDLEGPEHVVLQLVSLRAVPQIATPSLGRASAGSLLVPNRPRPSRRHLFSANKTAVLPITDRSVRAMASKSLALLTRRHFSSIRPHIYPGTRLPHAKYGGRHTVTMLPGDGIGPEMMEHIKRIFSFAHFPVDFETVELNSKDLNATSLEFALMACERNGIAIKGNIETKFDHPDFISRNVEIRRRLDLYANILHCVSIPTVPTRHKGIDIVLIRENTEGEYSGLEHETIKGVIESIKLVTRRNIERIARYTFEFAAANNRKKVTAVHKANIQKLGDGLFLQVARDMAKAEYPYIEFEAMIVDNASMQLVSRPQQFDIMLMPNLYGNIISNIACGLVGGPGLVSGINVGDKYALFETGTRNTGTALAGKNVANPTAFIRAAVDMLRYLGLDADAHRLSDALFATLTEQCLHTADIGGSEKTSTLIDSIIDNLATTPKEAEAH